MPSRATIRMEYQQIQPLRASFARLEKDLRTELRAALRESAKPVVQAVKDEVMKPPLGGGRRKSHSRGLRKNIAQGVGIRIALGSDVSIRIVSSPRRMAPGTQGLLRAYDNPRGWKHPLFGKTEHWYTQRGRPYFGSVIEAHRATMSTAIGNALEKVLGQMK